MRASPHKMHNTLLFLNGLESLVFATNYTTAELPDKADAGLFRLVQRSEQCPHRLLPDTINSCPMELRHRGHSFPLPQSKYNLYKLLYFVVSV